MTQYQFSYSGNEKLIDVLAAVKEVDFNAKDDDGNTQWPLHLAAMNGNGFNVSTDSSIRKSMSMCNIIFLFELNFVDNNGEFAIELIKHGADVNVINEHKKATALHICAENGN